MLLWGISNPILVLEEKCIACTEEYILVSMKIRLPVEFQESLKVHTTTDQASVVHHCGFAYIVTVFEICTLRQFYPNDIK